MARKEMTAAIEKERAFEARRAIFEEIEKERAYQDGKWDTAFDDKNTVNDWAAYINLYASERATKMGTENAKQRKGILKVATLAIAALETFDRNHGFAPRHYDVKGVTSR